MAQTKHPNKAIEEFGKWLMDISKYILTAVLISSLFSDVKDNPFLLAIGVIIVVLALSVGLLCIRFNSTAKTSKKRK